MGRTGVRGRGLLGRWGPNHAADPILTRWSKDEFGNKICNKDSQKPILQFVAIERAHEKEWAIPGVTHPTMISNDENQKYKLCLYIHSGNGW